MYVCYTTNNSSLQCDSISKSNQNKIACVNSSYTQTHTFYTHTHYYMLDHHTCAGRLARPALWPEQTGLLVRNKKIPDTAPRRLSSSQIMAVFTAQGAGRSFTRSLTHAHAHAKVRAWLISIIRMRRD